MINYFIFFAQLNNNQDLLNRIKILETKAERLDRLEADHVYLKAKVDRLEKEKSLQQTSPKIETSTNKPGVSFKATDFVLRWKDLTSQNSKTTNANRNGQVPAGRAIVPQSCRDLAAIGHTLDGFYQVKSASNPKKMATLMCDFNNDGTQGKFTILCNQNIDD